MPALLLDAVALAIIALVQGAGRKQGLPESGRPLPQQLT